jgi:DNA-binding LacI/PurR family transcriptional regulator
MATPGRKPRQQQAIIQRLATLARQHGDRLPSHRQLARELHASTRTVHRALQQLKAAGWIVGRPGRGTFAATPTRLPIALVFPHDPADTAHLWSRFYAALVNQTAAVAAQRGCDFQPFYRLDDARRAADYAPLERLVRTGQVGGLIFASHPHHLIGTPLLDQPGLPRVTLASEPTFAGIPVVTFNGTFVARAFDWLATQGCQRVAVLMQHDELPKHRLIEHARARGLLIKPDWLLPMTPHLCDAAAAYTRLLLTAPAGERVDGLLIGDDNYVAPALAGLRAGGVELGRDIHVLAHANFPWAGTRPAGVRRLGYDTAAVLKTCLDLLAAQRAGEAVPRLTELPALFENEVEQQKQQPTNAARETAPVLKGEET